MKLHFPDGNGGTNTIEVSDNISLYIENELTDWTLATASKTIKGGVKVGDGLYMTGESLNATPYALPTASKTIKGGVKVGEGLSMYGETLSADGYELPTASATQKGGIKIGDGLSMHVDSLNAIPYELPIASESIKGGVKVGQGLYMSGETLNVSLISDNDEGTLSGGGKLLYTDDDGTFGGLELGDGLKLEGNTLSAVPHYTIPTTPSSQSGGDTFITNNNIMYVNEEGDVSVLNLGDQFYIENNTLQVQMFNVTIEGGTTQNNSLVFVNNEGHVSNVRLGDNFYVQNDVLNYSGNNYVLPVATETRLGGVKVGDGLEITSDGVLSCTLTVESIESLVAETTGSTIEQRFLRVSILGYPPTNPVPPYCCRYYSSSWSVDTVSPGVPSDPNVVSSQYGALVLEKIFMDIDFKVYGDDGHEILFSTQDWTDFQSSHSSTNTSPYNVVVEGQNVATGKKLVGDTTVVPLTERMFDAMNKGYIYIEWGTESEMGNVKFQGSYLGALPDNPKNGRLVYKENMFYLYDGSTKKWIKWQVSAN